MPARAGGAQTIQYIRVKPDGNASFGCGQQWAATFADSLHPRSVFSIGYVPDDGWLALVARHLAHILWHTAGFCYQQSTTMQKQNANTEHFPNFVERLVENLIYASRWLLAPIYFGLSLALVALGLKFFQELIHLAPHVFEESETDLILVLLSMIDMALVGGLLVMVMISGYENFVSQLDIGRDKERLAWLGKMDSGSLKLKVASSIVAISSIHLLRMFMNTQQVPNDKLMWYVIIHLTFVMSAFVMSTMDKWGKR